MAAAAWESVEGGATVLAAQARLAAGLGGEFERRQQAAGRRAWETPAITTLPAWIEERAREAGIGVQLSPAQEQYLWEKAVLSGEEERAGLLDVGGTAAAAARAWQLAQAWELPWDGAEWERSEETTSFLGWARTVSRQCRQRGWITEGEMATRVAETIRRGTITAPERIWLAGFDDLAPQQKRLIQTLQGAGSRIEMWPRTEHRGGVRVIKAPDAEREIEAAAVWARHEWQREPGTSIGVVVAELARMRGAVERIFSQTFHPERAPWEESETAFHLSLGTPLERYPIFAAALNLLAWAIERREPVERGRAEALVSSPFLNEAEREAGRRARQRRRWGLEQRAEVGREELCQEWALARGAEQVRRQSERQSYRGWAQTFARALAAMGWPGERRLSSGEFQTSQKWTELLEDFSGLDEVAEGQVDAAAALKRLRRSAIGRVFQPQATQAPVQVMGWLEAAGLEFGKLWVAGLHDGVLPAPAAPHPFLPRRWQAERNMPHATAAQESGFAARVWERLRSSAAEVVASYPHWEGDVKLRPSPWLAGVEAERAEATATPAAGAATESFEDARAPAASKEQTQGGTKIFSEQAACPFRAFAHLRLHASGIETAPAGLAATTRGTLLHQVLRLVWERLQSQAGLMALTQEQLRECVRGCAEAAVQDEPQLQGRAGLAAVERERLSETVLAWLQVERKRAGFQVEARELDREAELGGLKLKIRLDRVDTLASGGRVLLDYKSGEANPSDWNSPRPNQPQLPIYLLTDPEMAAVEAMGFAQLKQGKMGFRGRARSEGILPDVSASHPGTWELQNEQWRQELERIASGYLAGDAAVAPKSRKDSCGYCDLPILCRISETETETEDWGPEEAEASDAG